MDPYKFAQTPSETAAYAFMGHIEACREVIDEIQEKIDDHLEVDPDLVNWINVSDAAKIEGALNVIVGMLQ